MVEVRAYMSSDLNEQITNRSEELEISKSEYMRLLASLDISIQRYQQLITYINLLHNRINEIHSKLGIYVTPLQNEAPIISLN